VKTPKLRVWREARGHSQRSLAREAKLNHFTVLRAERGEDIRPTNAAKIAAALDIEVADLMAEEDRPPAPLGIAPQETGQQRREAPQETGPTLAEWLEKRCGHAYLAMTKEEIEGLFDELPDTPDGERQARELGLQIHEEQKVFNAFPNNVSPEERIQMRKTIRDSISQVAVNYGVALFESGLYREFADEMARFVELQRTLNEAIA
jgi:transcriptional regulator with XRE-family HTH domain